MKKLKVLFINTTNSGVAYWRLYNFWNAAHRNHAFYGHMLWWKWDQYENAPNWEVDINDPQYRARILNELDQKVRQADMVIMQMAHFQISLDIFMGIREMYPHIRIIAECDDNFISTATYNPAFGAYVPGTDFRRIAVQQFRAADALIVSTPYLKQVYGDLNDHVYVVPNSIDKKMWNIKKEKDKPGIRIGWAGAWSHEEDLRLVEPVIKNILAKHREVRFCLVFGVPQFLRGIPRVETPIAGQSEKFVRIDKYPKFIRRLDWDIGIAPLVDNAFNRGKSNLRWLENAAFGTPVVASNVGHFAESITHGTDGFLASDEKEFEGYLDLLISDRKLRLAVGARAKDKALSTFNVDNTVFDYEAILREIVERGRVPKNEAEINSEELKVVEPGVLIR